MSPIDLIEAQHHLQSAPPTSAPPSAMSSNIVIDPFSLNNFGSMLDTSLSPGRSTAGELSLRCASSSMSLLLLSLPPVPQPSATAPPCPHHQPPACFNSSFSSILNSSRVHRTNQKERSWIVGLLFCSTRSRLKTLRGLFRNPKRGEWSSTYFDDQNMPLPLDLIERFCLSCDTWLKAKPVRLPLISLFLSFPFSPIPYPSPISILPSPSPTLSSHIPPSLSSHSSPLPPFPPYLPHSPLPSP